MILLLALLFSIAISLARGGRFLWLAQVSLRLGWLAIVAFALQWSIIYAPLPRSEGLLGPRTLLLMASYLLVVVVVVANRRVPGLPLIAIGLGLNLLVMVANGGFMPVTMEAVEHAGLTHLALGTEPERASRPPKTSSCRPRRHGYGCSATYSWCRPHCPSERCSALVMSSWLRASLCCSSAPCAPWATLCARIVSQGSRARPSSAESGASRALVARPHIARQAYRVSKELPHGA